MPRVCLSLIVSLCVIFETGCGARKLGFEPKTAPEITAVTIDPLLEDDKNNKENTWLKKYQDRIASGTCTDGIKQVNGKCSDGTAYADFAKGLRNSYIEAIRAKIDDNYRHFKANLYSGNAVFGLASDWAVIGLSGAGSVVADTALKSILAVAAGGVTGANASYQKQVLNQQNTLAIAAAMEAARSGQYLLISRSETSDLTKYSMEEALVNLRQYYDAGTMLGGLLYIQGQMQSQSLSNQKNSQGLRTAPLSVTTVTLIGGTVNTGYSAPLEATGGAQPYTWKIVGSLPPGLTLTPDTGVIWGAPTSAGTSKFSVQVTDSSTPAQTVSYDLSIVVTNPQPPQQPVQPAQSKPQ
jgi:Putative Ig domain